MRNIFVSLYFTQKTVLSSNFSGRIIEKRWLTLENPDLIKRRVYLRPRNVKISRLLTKKYFIIFGKYQERDFYELSRMCENTWTVHGDCWRWLWFFVFRIGNFQSFGLNKLTQRSWRHFCVLCVNRKNGGTSMVTVLIVI